MREMVTRGDLPHWYVAGMPHFVTYRLANSIPARLMRQWREERERLGRRAPPPGKTVAAYRMDLHKRLFGQYDEYLHTHPGRACLADSRVAAMIQDNLHHHNGGKYELLAYCVMGNHVHVVLQPFDVGQAASLPAEGSFRHEEFGFSDEIEDSRSPLTGIMHSLKSYAANEANRLLGRWGQFWQHESYDHWVRDVDELERIVEYVALNPVKAGLCHRPSEWAFSSAHERFQRDGSNSALIGRLRDDWRRTT